MALRLNRYTTRRITAAIIDHALKDEKQQVSVIEATLAFAVYKDQLGKEYNAILNAKKHWFECIDSLYVTFGTTSMHLSLYTQEEHAKDIPDAQKRYPAPYYLSSGDVVPKYKSTTALYKASRKYKQRQDALTKKHATIQQQMRVLFASISTVEQLYELMPKCEPLVEPIVKSYRTTPKKVSRKGTISPSTVAADNVNEQVGW